MPAGDVGLERQTFRQRFEVLMREPVADGYGGVDAQRYHHVTQALYRLTGEALTEIDRLQAQLAGVQAQLVTRGPYCALHGEYQPCSQHRWVDAGQAAQPEGERAR